VTVLKADSLFRSVRRDFNFYFIHSYHLECEGQYISARCEYDVPVTAALEKDHIFATQFHPEKSQENGLRILREFITFVDNYGLPGEAPC
jgi:glutamine amidotransferase